MNETIASQILAVRDTGRTNMLDAKGVFETAIALGHDELADFIFCHSEAYIIFLISGEFDDIAGAVAV